jgi:hypothetical protein
MQKVTAISAGTEKGVKKVNLISPLIVTTMGIETPGHIIGRTVELEQWEPTKILMITG